jgi:hypothetical protein
MGSALGPGPPAPHHARAYAIVREPASGPWERAHRGGVILLTGHANISLALKTTADSARIGGDRFSSGKAMAGRSQGRDAWQI